MPLRILKQKEDKYLLNKNHKLEIRAISQTKRNIEIQSQSQS